MDYELLHQISLLDREKLKLEKALADKGEEQLLGSIKKEYDSMRKKYDELVKNRDSMKDKIEDFSAQIEAKTKEKKDVEKNIYSSANLKAIEGYQKNYERLDNEIKLLEEEIYELMEKNDGMDKETKEIKPVINRVRENFNTKLAAYREKKKDLQINLEDMNRRRTVLVNEASEDSIKEYEEICKKSGYGMSELKGDICSGCNMSVPAAVINAMKGSNKLYKCPNCGRFLFILKD